MTAYQFFSIKNIQAKNAIKFSKTGYCSGAGFKNMNYPDTLKSLKLPSLEWRWLIADIILTYNFLLKNKNRHEVATSKLVLTTVALTSKNFLV